MGQSGRHDCDRSRICELSKLPWCQLDTHVLLVHEVEWLALVLEVVEGLDTLTRSIEQASDVLALLILSSELSIVLELVNVFIDDRFLISLSHHR